MTEELSTVQVPTKKKKVKKQLSIGAVHIFASFNNTIISVTDQSGNVYSSSSSGACGFRGSKKGTAYAAQIAAEKAINLAKSSFGLTKVDVYVKGIGQGRDAAIRTIISADVMISSITDQTTKPHGGVRPRKARRG